MTAEFRRQRSEDRSQKSEIGGQKSEIRGQISKFGMGKLEKKEQRAESAGHRVKGLVDN